MFLMWIIPVLLIGFVVYAISGNNVINFFKPAASRVCSHCSQPAQHTWKVCPHCGQTL
jgi:predicted amidophosphoribosyltransferase